MKIKSARGSKYPAALKCVFLNVMETSRGAVNGIHAAYNGVDVDARWLIGQLWNCPDPLPDAVALDLYQDGKATYATAARRWLKGERKAACLDCRVNTTAQDDYYMVKDALWDQAVGRKGMVCIDCLERRVGRALKWSDFDMACPINAEYLLLGPGQKHVNDLDPIIEAGLAHSYARVFPYTAEALFEAVDAREKRRSEAKHRHNRAASSHPL